MGPFRRRSQSSLYNLFNCQLEDKGPNSDKYLTWTTVKPNYELIDWLCSFGRKEPEPQRIGIGRIRSDGKVASVRLANIKWYFREIGTINGIG